MSRARQIALLVAINAVARTIVEEMLHHVCGYSEIELTLRRRMTTCLDRLKAWEPMPNYRGMFDTTAVSHQALQAFLRPDDEDYDTLLNMILEEEDASTRSEELSDPP